MRYGRRVGGPRAPYADPQTAPGRAIEALGTDQQRAFYGQVAHHLAAVDEGRGASRAAVGYLIGINREG